jgi:sugar-specific transcriptional regulator TrmB
LIRPAARRWWGLEVLTISGKGEGELEAKLRRLLGLSGYEARVYLALLRLGRAQPREVAREAGVPQQRVYDVLRSLEWRGLAQRAGDSYAPTPPGDAMAAEAKRKILEAKREAEEIESLASDLSRLAASSPGESVLLIHGLEATLSWASAVAAACGEKPLFTAYKAVERIRDLWPLLKALLERLPRGALVLVPDDAEIPSEALGEASRRGVVVKRAPCILLDMMVACETVIIGLPGPGGDVVSVVVKSREFAEAMKKRLEALSSG